MSSVAEKISTQLNTRRELEDRGYFLQTPPVSIIVLDPAGGGEDGNAVVWMDREEYQHGEPTDADFGVLPLARVKLAYQMDSAMEWSDVMAKMLNLHRYMMIRENNRLCHKYFMVVETNGVGYGYQKRLVEKIGAHRVIGIQTTPGTKDVTYNEKGLCMPRLPGLDDLRMRIESQVFKIQKEAPGAKDLNSQMRAFVWKAKGRPEALEGQRDDLVMAAALGNWVAFKVLPLVLKAKSFR